MTLAVDGIDSGRGNGFARSGRSGSRGTGLLAMLLLALSTPHVVAQANTDADSIRALRAASNRAIAGHDAKALVSFMDEDYVITDSTGHIEYSRQGRAERWQGHFATFQDVVYVRTPSKVTVSEAYPHAMENGAWVGSMTTPQGKLEKGGEYAAVWRKVDGVWKIHSEVFVALYCRGKGC